MKEFKEIIIHCTATPENKEYSVATITRWHLARGFRTIGYHYLIGLDGEVRKGRSLKYNGAHVKGRNKDTIGISYVGGCTKDMKPKDTRTKKQKEALIKLILELKNEYPSIKLISGHNEYSNKACPCFNVKEEYGTL